MDKNTLLTLVKVEKETSFEPTGFVRRAIETMGVIEYCINAASGTFWRRDENGVSSTHNLQTSFGDGTVLADRTFIHYPSHDQSEFSFIANGRKISKTTTQIIQHPNTSVKQIICYDLNGDITLASGVENAILETVLIAVVTINVAKQKKIVFGDERHGLMSSETHLAEHKQGAKWTRQDDGFLLSGITDNGSTYSNITGGEILDEDITHVIGATTNAPFVYLEGVEWDLSDVNDTNLALKVNGLVVYNSFNGTNWILTPIGGDYIIMFFFVTNDGENPIFKIVGQKLYENRTLARQDFHGACTKILSGNLPTPEFLAVYGVIVHNESIGQVEKGADNEIYIDYRYGFPVSMYE